MMIQTTVPSAFAALLLILGLAALGPAPVRAAEEPYRLADIDQTPDPPFTLSSEVPADFFALGDRLLFSTAGSDSDEGILWSTDGTAAGTVQLSSSICPADCGRIRHVATWHGIALLEIADVATGSYALARTDGTTAGTFVLIGSPPGGSPAYYSAEVAAPPGAAYFFFQACSFQPACELWRSDGTAAGTAIVRDAGGLSLTEPHSLTVCGDKVALIAYAGEEGATDLWTTDGTPAGTLLLSEVTESYDSYSRIVAGLRSGVVLISAHRMQRPRRQLDDCRRRQGRLRDAP